jgi:tRNA threonylcarbamoyladenosine biosynthesis protein TsaB
MNQEVRIKENTLYIDTSDSNNIFVRLTVGDKTFEEADIQNIKKAQIVLELVDKVLKKAQLELSDVKKIEVNRGPGSYTGLKVGVSVANALSLILQVPVNDKKLGETETPEY